MRTPSKTEYERALAAMSGRCMAPIHEGRKGGLPSLFKSKHARLNNEEDEVCHHVKVISAYVSSLERRANAAEDHVFEMIDGNEQEIMSPIGEAASAENPTGDAVCTGCVGKKHKCKACGGH